MPHRFKVEVRDRNGEADYEVTDMVRESMWDAGWIAYYDNDDDPDDPATFSATTDVDDVYDALIDIMHFRISLYDRFPELTMRFRRYRPEPAFVH